MKAGIFIAITLSFGLQANILDFYCFKFPEEISTFKAMKKYVGDETIWRAETRESALEKMARLFSLNDKPEGDYIKAFGEPLLLAIVRDAVVRFKINLFDDQNLDVNTTFNHPKLNNIEVSIVNTAGDKKIAFMPLFKVGGVKDKITLAQFENDKDNFFVIKKKNWNNQKIEDRFLSRRQMKKDEVDCGYDTHRCPVIPYFSGLTLDQINFSKLTEADVQSLSLALKEETEDYSNTTRGALAWQTFPGANVIVNIQKSPEPGTNKFSVHLVDYDQDTQNPTVDISLRDNVPKTQGWLEDYLKENVIGGNCLQLDD